MPNSSDTAKNGSSATVHELKTWPGPFGRVWTNAKTAEWRKNDRDFKVGDVLNLREWDPDTESYTGRSLVRVVTDVFGGRFGMPEGYVVLSIRPPIATDLIRG